MANTSSAKKAQRSSKRRHVFNARRKKTMKDAMKDADKMILAKKTADVTKALPELYQAIDKAAKNHTINKNTAARMKSRIAKRVFALSR
jgi:small subunit ribosomal protein S20